MTSRSHTAPDQDASTQAFTSLTHEIIDVVRTVGAGLALALAFQAVAFQPFTIPSSSMEPGLVTGDYIVVSKFAYGWSRASLPLTALLSDGRIAGRLARRGDVVVFRLPREPAQVWIKRVIGLPGDRVEVRDGMVFVNGAALEQQVLETVRDQGESGSPVTVLSETQADGRSYRIYDRGPSHPGDDTGPMVVPEGQYLVMGDNRDNSLDGRWPRELGIGFLPAENLVGRAEVIVASWEPRSSLFKPWTWLRLRAGRFWRPIS